MITGMIETSRTAWIMAFLMALAAHAALALTFALPTTGTAEKPAGAPIAVTGSLASILGGAQPVRAASPDQVMPVEAAPPGVTAVPAERAVQPVASSLTTPAEDAALPLVPVRPAHSGALAALPPANTKPVEAARPAPIKPVEPSTRTIRPEQKRRPKKASVEKNVKGPLTEQKRVPRRPGSKRDGAAGSNRGGRGGRSLTNAGSISSYGARVRSRIIGNVPSASGRGRVVLSFAVSAGGSLRYVRIARTSGSSSLDRAAVAAVRRAAPFPKPPAGSSARQLQFVIPIAFR